MRLVSNLLYTEMVRATNFKTELRENIELPQMYLKSNGPKTKLIHLIGNYSL